MTQSLIQTLLERKETLMTYAPAESDEHTPFVPTIVRSLAPKVLASMPTATPVEIPQKLIDMLSLKRPHGGAGETTFINTYLIPHVSEMLVDGEGATKTTSAYIHHIPNKNGSDATTLWSSHTDTVHYCTDPTQVVEVDREKALIYKMDGEPLGADNAAGVWLLLEMMAAKVPGMYVFHRGEEKGGIGSWAIAKNYQKWLTQFTHAIAFDRKATCSVITHQMVGRCCSDDFAEQMSALLTDEDCTYILAPDDTGSFTDTANYIDVIPECTNVSVGYYNEHGGDETLDVAYLLWLRDRMVTLFGAEEPPVLIVKRDPSVPEPRASYGSHSSKNYGWDWQINDAFDLEMEVTDEYDVDLLRWKDLVKWIRLNDAEIVADLLKSLADKLLYSVDAKEEVKK